MKKCELCSTGVPGCRLHPSRRCEHHSNQVWGALPAPAPRACEQHGTGLPGSHVGIHTWRVLRASWCGAVRLAPSFLQPPAGSPQMMAPQSMSPPCQVSMLVGMGARLHLQLRCCMGLCCPQCWELPSSVVWLEGAFTRSLLWRAGRAQQGCLWHCTEGTTAGRAAALCQQSHGYGCRCLVMYYSGRCL